MASISKQDLDTIRSAAFEDPQSKGMAGSDTTILLVFVGIVFISGGVIRLLCWLHRGDEEERRGRRDQNRNREENIRNNRNRDEQNREEHNREVRMRMREARNQNNISRSTGTGINGPQSNARSHHNVPSSSAQSSTQPSPYLQYHIEQAQSDQPRTLHNQSDQNQRGPTQHSATRLTPAQSGQTQPNQAATSRSRSTGQEAIRPRNFRSETTLTGPTRSGAIPSAPPLSILSDQTRSPRDITNRNLHNKSPNPPPPSYRDLFPSDSSGESHL